MYSLDVEVNNSMKIIGIGQAGCMIVNNLNKFETPNVSYYGLSFEIEVPDCLTDNGITYLLRASGEDKEFNKKQFSSLVKRKDFVFLVGNPQEENVLDVVNQLSSFMSDYDCVVMGMINTSDPIEGVTNMKPFLVTCDCGTPEGAIKTVSYILETVHAVLMEKDIIAVDVEDLDFVLHNGKVPYIGVGVADTKEEVIKNALVSELCSNCSTDVTALCIHVTSYGKTLEIEDINDIIGGIRDYFPSEMNIMYGAAVSNDINPELGNDGTLKVAIIGS